MKKLRKIMKTAGAAAMSLALVLSMSACMVKDDNGSKDNKSKKTEAKENKDDQGTDEGKSTEGGSDDSKEAPDDIWAPFDETVVITTIGSENSGIQFEEGDDYGNNPWYRAFKDRFNVDLQNKWISNEYSTKLNLSIADRDLPDVFHVDAERLATLQKADMIMELDDVIEQYGSDTIKGYWKDYKDIWDTAVFDGKLYGIPQMSYGIIDQFPTIWIRQDWMEEGGFDEPKTMDDVLEIATSFAEKHGGYALAEDRSLQNFYRLCLSWGAHPGIWVEQEDGSIGYGSVQPEMKEALKAYSEWYEKGILKEDFTTMSSEQMFQDLIEGNCGVTPMEQWFGYNPMPDVIANQGPEAIFLPYEIPMQDGSEFKGSVYFTNYGYNVINKDCENPEAVMKLVNFFAYMMDDAIEGGESEEFINSLYANAYPNLVESIRVINPMTDYNQYVQVKDAVDRYIAGEEVDTSQLGKNVTKYLNCVKWIDSKDKAGIGDWLQQGNDRSAYGLAKGYVDNKQYVEDAMWGAPTETLRSAGSTLDDILKEGFTKIIIGDEPLDYFDTLVEQWNKAGGETATQEINETYGK